MIVRTSSPTTGLVALCVTQVVSWGLLYYSIPTAAGQVADATGWSRAMVTAAFSAGLLVSAAAGIPAGRLLDRYGPGVTMTAGTVIGGLGLCCVALSPDLLVFLVGWLVAGLAQSLVLYPSAFAAITRWYGERRVRPLTIVTLAGGLASTIFAPVVALLVTRLGWRDGYLVMAMILVVITGPLHALLFRVPWHSRRVDTRTIDDAHVRQVTRSARFRILQAVLAAIGLGMFAVTVNLVPLLLDRGASYGLAAVGLGLVGVGQVAGRIGFALVPRRKPPGWRLGFISAGSALSLLLLGVLPGPLGLLLAVGILAGTARGCQTLIQATAVADRWGTKNFATINGVFVAPLTAAGAVAPAFGAWLGGQLGFGMMAGLMAALVGAAAVVGSRT